MESEARLAAMRGPAVYLPDSKIGLRTSLDVFSSCYIFFTSSLNP